MIRLRTEGLSWRRIDDEIVVLDSRASAYFAVNGTGSTLWESLQEGCERGDLVAALAAANNLTNDQAELDVAAFLDLLGELGFLED